MTHTFPIGASPLVRQNMSSVREAFRLHRKARAQRALWCFYREHSMLQEAQTTWQSMLEDLRDASQQWRLTLGASQDPGVPLRMGTPRRC